MVLMVLYILSNVPLSLHMHQNVCALFLGTSLRRGPDLVQVSVENVIPRILAASV